MRKAFKSLLLAFTTLIAGTVAYALLLAFTTLIAGTVAYAQVTTSALSGRVVDQNGEPVVGAAVLAQHEPSGTIYGAVTNAEGRYSIQGMRTGGPYKVDFSCLGYSDATYTGVVLQLAETYSLNAKIAESTEMLQGTVVVASPTSKFAGRNAIEAPFIFKHDHYYYLFVSWDYCCRGTKSNYRVAVGRSKSVSGPYLDRDGKDMLKGGGTILLEGDKQEYEAAGHCAAYHFGDDDLFICHGYSAKQNGTALLVQRKISWTPDGCPKLA